MSYLGKKLIIKIAIDFFKWEASLRNCIWCGRCNTWLSACTCEAIITSLYIYITRILYIIMFQTTEMIDSWNLKQSLGLWLGFKTVSWFGALLCKVCSAAANPNWQCCDVFHRNHKSNVTIKQQIIIEFNVLEIYQWRVGSKYQFMFNLSITQKWKCNESHV